MVFLSLEDPDELHDHTRVQAGRVQAVDAVLDLVLQAQPYRRSWKLIYWVKNSKTFIVYANLVCVKHCGKKKMPNV